MKNADLLWTIISGIAGILLMLIRASMKWQRTVDTLTHVVDRLTEVVSDNAREHSQLDQRIRWLETHLWQSRSKD